MTDLAVAFLGVPLVDHALKWLVARSLGSGSLSLGALGVVQIRRAPMWLMRVRPRVDPAAVWAVWVSAAVALFLACVALCAPGWPFGLLLGGSLSHALETSRHGSVSDYVALRGWPAFDLADVALAIGAVGTLSALAVALLAGLPP
jgi:signal peptidase II